MEKKGIAGKSPAGDAAQITVDMLSAELRRRLTPIYGAGEAQAMVRLIFHHLKGWNATELIINGDFPVSQRVIAACGNILARLAKHEPLQYILGEARFYGLDLKVTPDVLIPRPETAELVDMIVSANTSRSDLRVLDAGTGSGAIAVALARNLPFAEVSALDVSEGALRVARENADALHLSLRFLHADIFTWTPQRHSFDIVVSNPPYVTESEKKDMDANVLDYEPAGALFVPDDDPLRFYRRIAGISLDGLVPGGLLYFEINPLFERQLAAMLEEMGYLNVRADRDAQGKWRFMSATTPRYNSVRRVLTRND